MTSGAYQRPESVLVVVCTAGGEVLLLQRQQPSDFWQSVTGALEQNETPIAAARRELFEETGLAAELQDCHRVNEFPIMAEWRTRYAPGTERNREYVFAAVCDERPEVTIDPREHQALCWLPKQAAARRASSWTNRDAILAYVP